MIDSIYCTRGLPACTGVHSRVVDRSAGAGSDRNAVQLAAAKREQEAPAFEVTVERQVQDDPAGVSVEVDDLGRHGSAAAQRDAKRQHLRLRRVRPALAKRVAAERAQGGHWSRADERGQLGARRLERP